MVNKVRKVIVKHRTMKNIFFLTCIISVVSCAKSKELVNLQTKEFFPIAVWYQDPSSANDYKEIGINMFIAIPGGLNEDRLNQLKNAGMKVICEPYEYEMTKLYEHAIVAWMHGDEPDNAQWNESKKSYDPCISPQLVINDYIKMKKNDPSRPVYLNLGRGVSYTNWIGRGTCTGDTASYKIDNNGYLKGCDIASFDIYPVNSHEVGIKDSLWLVGDGINNLKRWSNNSKPVWCWIETTRISEEATRKPNINEVKAQVWMAIISGADGIGYFCHSFYPKLDTKAMLNDVDMKKGIKSINQDITSLALVLSRPNTKYVTAIKSTNEVPIKVMTKKYSDSNYIFCVPMKPGETQVTFSVKKGKTVTVIGEKRTIPVINGMFTDNFRDYSVHLYKVN